jgi:hypothetical protein
MLIDNYSAGRTASMTVGWIVGIFVSDIFDAIREVRKENDRK